MNTFLWLMPMIAGAYLALGSFLMHTKNIRSAIIFQVLPFALGVLTCIAAAKQAGFL